MRSLQQWACVRTEIPCGLRRGAWYRVRRLLAREVVLEVHGQPRTLPRAYVTLSLSAPNRWSVVARPVATAGAVTAPAETHAVCPSCCERAALTGRLDSMRCPRCNGLFAVAWGDHEMAAG